jgi:ABC-type multidrug transport system fused ATPase/permease subunit
MFTLRGRQAYIVTAVSSPVSLLSALNYRQCHDFKGNMGQGLTTVVNNTGNNLSHVTTTPATIYCQ